MPMMAVHVTNEYFNHTTVHPVGLATLVCCILAILCLPRRLAMLPFLGMLLFIPSAQRIVLLSLDFNYLRILVIVGWIRLLMRSEYRIEWCRLDSWFMAWIAFLNCAMLLRTSGSMIVYQMGLTLDAVGGYFLVRNLVREREDLLLIARVCALFSVPIAMAFLLEHATQRNLFAAFGGVHEITMVREGRLRCMGPYNHPILAGCVWASLAPLCAGLWPREGKDRIWAVIGVLASGIIVVCSSSSTPVFGAAAAAMGWALFRARGHLRAIRWAIALGIIGLHLVMKAPVWHLLARVSAVGGSTGYHRYLLIDRFIHRFSEWALIGVNSTAHWFSGALDLTNFFVVQGVQGGLLTFVCFIGMVAAAFAGVGRMIRASRATRTDLWLAWGLGVSILTHCACFIGVSYFGQSTTLWYMTLGMAGSLSVMPVMHHASVMQSAQRLVNNMVPVRRHSAPSHSVSTLRDTVDCC